MKLLVRPSLLRGEIAVTGSKSHTIRGIAAALAANGTSVLVAPLESADTRSTLEAARLLGAKVREHDDVWEITGTGGVFTDPGRTLDLGNSGTGMRMLTGLCAKQSFPIRFDGDESLRTRLMAGLFDALAPLGCRIESADGKCPFTVEGPLSGGATRVDGTTSQFLTSLLFLLPTLAEDSTVDLDFLNEKPYIGITGSRGSIRSASAMRRVTTCCTGGFRAGSRFRRSAGSSLPIFQRRRFRFSRRRWRATAS